MKNDFKFLKDHEQMHNYTMPIIYIIDEGWFYIVTTVSRVTVLDVVYFTNYVCSL